MNYHSDDYLVFMFIDDNDDDQIHEKQDDEVTIYRKDY